MGTTDLLPEPDAPLPAAGPNGQGAAERDGGQQPARIGICVSGGGIRSASFGLGALQVLQRHGIVQRAAFLSAVSGGSYIVGAMALVTKGNTKWDREHGGKFETPDAKSCPPSAGTAPKSSTCGTTCAT